MSMIMAGIGSALGSLGASLFGGGSTPDLSGAADKIGTAGITSSLSQQTAPQPTQPSVEGSQASSLLEKTMRDTVQGIATGGGQRIAKEALDGVFGSATSGARMGKETRAYLDAAYPELNPWEKAGAGGTMAGAQGGAAASQQSIVDKQLANQVKIAEANNETQLKQAGIASATSIKNNQDNIALAAQKQPHEINVLKQQVANLAAQEGLTNEQRRSAAQSIVESSARVNNIHLSSEQIKKATDKIVQETENMAGGQTVLGRGLSDLEHYGDRSNKWFMDKIDSVKSDAMPWIDKAGDAISKSFDMYKKSMGIGSSVN